MDAASKRDDEISELTAKEKLYKIARDNSGRYADTNRAVDGVIAELMKRRCLRDTLRSYMERIAIREVISNIRENDIKSMSGKPGISRLCESVGMATSGHAGIILDRIDRAARMTKPGGAARDFGRTSEELAIAFNRNNFLSKYMVNGMRLGDCTGDQLRELAEVHSSQIAGLKSKVRFYIAIADKCGSDRVGKRMKDEEAYDLLQTINGNRPKSPERSKVAA